MVAIMMIATNFLGMLCYFRLGELGQLCLCLWTIGQLCLGGPGYSSCTVKKFSYWLYFWSSDNCSKSIQIWSSSFPVWLTGAVKPIRGEGRSLQDYRYDTWRVCLWRLLGWWSGRRQYGWELLLFPFSNITLLKVIPGLSVSPRNDAWGTVTCTDQMTCHFPHLDTSSHWSCNKGALLQPFSSKTRI